MNFNVFIWNGILEEMTRRRVVDRYSAAALDITAAVVRSSAANRWRIFLIRASFFSAVIQSVAGKVKVSLFMQERKDIISKMSYNILTINALELRNYWKQLLDNYQQSFTFDYNLVDWERLAKIIRKRLALLSSSFGGLIAFVGILSENPDCKSCVDHGDLRSSGYLEACWYDLTQDPYNYCELLDQRSYTTKFLKIFLNFIFLQDHDLKVMDESTFEQNIMIPLQDIMIKETLLDFVGSHKPKPKFTIEGNTFRVIAEGASTTKKHVRYKAYLTTKGFQARGFISNGGHGGHSKVSTVGQSTATTVGSYCQVDVSVREQYKQTLAHNTHLIFDRRQSFFYCMCGREELGELLPKLFLASIQIKAFFLHIAARNIKI
ncbi:hypothetical protein INT47_007695 [Mucor saturninus]|uniref:Uncharacterized protein n=1 Tax=Mucor saturninus TaxID=64648 RepID=A0A8H7QXE6_9FUNG|nr:hypothetical protein INT47_007695 [Mucor saturninus]